MTVLQHSVIESGGYNIDRSLRFRSSASAYLSRTNVASPTNNKIFTFSAWIKRGQLSSSAPFPIISGGPDTNNFFDFFFDGDSLNVSQYSGATYQLRYNTVNAGSGAVFRDVSAWYHIVLAIDMTQASGANGVKLYVNNVQQTWNYTAAYVQNSSMYPNTGSAASKICLRTAGTNYFDGYLAEVNFIDGQALTPSSFGQTDAVTGVWTPKKYTGTYGTNGFYLPFSLQNQSTYAGSFNGTNQYLTATSASAFDFGSGDFTIEGWFYATGKSTRHQAMVLKGSPTTNNAYDWRLYWGDTSNNELWFDCAAFSFSGAASSNDLVLNAWNHIAVTRNGSSGRMFLNGNLAYSTATATGSIGNSYTTLSIGAGNVGSAGQTYFTGNISNLRIVKGTSLYNAPFVPSSQPLTAVSGTQILTLQDSSIVDNSSNALTITNNNTVTTATATPFANPDLTADYSGNNNNWQKNNISLTAGATYDSMTDVPTLTSATAANYCVLNPLDWVQTSFPITNGNLTWTSTTTAGGSSRGTVGVTTGKWYWEILATSVGSGSCGVGVAKDGSTNFGSGQALYTSNTGQKYIDGVNTAYGATWATNDLIGIAYDADAGQITFYKNNASQSAITLSGYAGVNVCPVVSDGSSLAFTLDANFGQRPFSYTPPTGFKALNTFNLPDPTIKKPNQYMDVKVRTGAGAASSVTGIGFQPDFVWVKDRTAAQTHGLFDSVRGVQNLLQSNSTAAELTSSNYLTAFNSDGYSFGSGTQFLNANTDNYVDWLWKKGATPGFDIVTYTGNGANRTISHSLGIAPSLMILKNRTTTYDWPVYHASIGNANFLTLDTTNASGSNSTMWNNTSPTSSVFTVGTNAYVNNNAQNYVAYLFAEIAGFSKFGSYTGNGSNDGPFVYCGFRPRYIMIKKTNAASPNGWEIWDTARDTYNQAYKRLWANLSDAENTTTPEADILSNGFKVRTVSNDVNTSGGTYIYAAFAENPFKYSNAR